MRISLQKLFTQRTIFHSGGPGSGFHSHRGRPGEIGGSSKEGGGRTLEDILAEQDKLNEQTPKDIHRKRVEDTVRKLGFPTERVKSTEDQGYLFNVGDQQFRAGADYNPQTGEIQIFDVDEMSDSSMEGILTHEIQHDRWKKYHDAYQKQFVEIQRSIRGTDESEWLIRMDGSLRNSKDKKRYWAYDLHENFISIQSDNWNILASKDGVSDYSKAYWKQAVSTGSAFDYDRAVDETLAEIARIDIGSPRTGDVPIDPVWQDLYRKVKRGAGAVKNQLLFLFGVEHG